MTLLRNAAFSFAGALLPALALFVTIPLIVHRLGAEAYGALVLVTSIVGYFGILDLNATAGTVKFVAEHHARRDAPRVSQVVSMALAVHLGLGLLGAAALFFGAQALVQQVFKVEPHWQAQAQLALRWAAAAFFVTQVHALLQGLPQAVQRYDVVGRLDAWFGSLVPLTTLAVVLLGGGLVAIVVARLVLSVINVVALWHAVRALLPDLRLARPDAGTVRGLASFSAFSWLQRLASLTTLNADKLLIGVQHSLAALAAYAIPYTLGSRVFGLLYRLQQVLFPLASALSAVGDLERLRRSSIMVQRYTLFLNVSACLLCALFAKELLHYWLQGRAGAASAVVLVLVAYTLLADSLTNVPSLVNDGLGRPHVTAWAAVLRALLGVSAAAAALAWAGIVALAWSQLVVSLLMALGFLWYVHRRSLPWRLGDALRPVYALNAVVLFVGTALLVWRWPAPVLAPAPFALFAAGSTLLLAAIGWWLVLDAEHRLRLSTAVRLRLRTG